MNNIDVSLKADSEAFDVRIKQLIDEHKETIKVLDREIEELDIKLRDKEMQHDRSENADYHIAVDSRDLKTSVRNMLIKKVEEMESSRGEYKPTGFVSVGTTLEIKIQSINGSKNISSIVGSKDKFIIKIVSDGTSKATVGLVSVDTPVATAMLGHKASDIVEVKATYGKVLYSIERVY